MTRTPAQWADVYLDALCTAQDVPLRDVFSQAMAQAREEAMGEAAKECLAVADWPINSYCRNQLHHCAERIEARKTKP